MCLYSYIRYRHESASNPLYAEINYAVETLGQPLFDLFVRLCDQLAQIQQQTGGNIVDIMGPLLKTLHLLTEVFYSLNYQDLPGFFQDSMKGWFDRYQRLILNFQANIWEQERKKKDPEMEEPSELEELQTSVCGIITLYTYKYEDEFKESVDISLSLSLSHFVACLPPLPFFF